MKCKLSKYIVVSEPLDDRDDIRSERIIYSTRTGKGIKVTSYVVGLLREGEFDGIPDRLYTVLMYHEIIVPADEEELELVVERKRLTAIDNRLRRHLVLVRDQSDTAEALMDWTLPESGQHELVVTVEIKDVQQGMQHLDQVLHRLGRIDLAYRGIDIELLVTAKEAGKLAEYLPLSNPPFQRLTFHYTAGMGSFPNYLAALCRLMRQVDYLKTLPVAVLLQPDAVPEQEFSEITRCLSELSTYPNLQLQVDLVTNAGQTPEAHELAFIIQLQKASVKAAFIPQIDHNFFLSGSPAASPVECYESSGWPAPAHTAGPSRCGYSEDFAYSIRQGSVICSGCLYLPLCGGSPEKLQNDSTCPSFTRNFMQKVEYMYQFQLQKQ